MRFRPQFSIFKDCLARHILSQPGFGDSASELDEFTSFLSEEAWSTLPNNLRNLTYETKTSIPDVDNLSLDTTSTTFTETLTSYGITSDDESALQFLRKIAEEYIAEASAPPPVWSSTRTQECEICEREVPLTYHHLIPRATHAKVLKRKWHPESMINSVAWLCRPCHNVVHRVATKEELALNYHTVDLLLEREDIQKWRNYATKQRFGIRRG